MHRNKQAHELAYSITSSARPSTGSGTVMPFAVLRFRNNSTFVPCWTGKSLGFSPLRIRNRVFDPDQLGREAARSISKYLNRSRRSPGFPTSVIDLLHASQ